MEQFVDKLIEEFCIVESKYFNIDVARNDIKTMLSDALSKYKNGSYSQKDKEEQDCFTSDVAEQVQSVLFCCDDVDWRMRDADLRIRDLVAHYIEKSAKHYTLYRLNEEPEHVRVWEGRINGELIKIIINPTDQRVPRYLIVSPSVQIFGLHYHEMPNSFKAAYQTAMDILGHVGKKMGASLINYRIEGNLHCRSTDPEPLHPHIHVVFRFPHGSDILGIMESQDPCFGKDYPLSDGKTKIDESLCTRLAYETRKLFREEAFIVPQVNSNGSI